MPSLDKMKKKEGPPALGQKDSDDMRNMVMLGVDLMEQGGNDAIEKALTSSQDPTQVVGHVLAQVLMSLAETGGKELDVDPRIFLAKGGWLEAMLDYIEVRFGLPKEFSDEAWMAVVEMIKAQTQAGSQAPQGAAPQGPAPVGPEAAAQQGLASNGQPMQQSGPPMAGNGGGMM